MTTPRNWGPGHPSYPRAKPSSTKLDEMRAYVEQADKNFRSDAAVSLYREGLIAGKLAASSEMLALALAAIDEARAEERARCVAALRAHLHAKNSMFNMAVETLAPTLSPDEVNALRRPMFYGASTYFRLIELGLARWIDGGNTITPLALGRAVLAVLDAQPSAPEQAAPSQGYAVDGPRPRRFVVDGITSKDTSEAATLKEAREAADLWRDAFGGTVRPLAEQAEPSQASHRDMGARQREALDKLRKAIHFTTDDRDDGAPSTPAEHALLALQRACETRDWDATNAAAACLCETLADESRALRLAAAAVFGDEFRRKGDLT